MKIWTKWALLGGLLLMMFQLSGCALINVNPEKDNAEVIATVDGEDILKSNYNNYLAMVQMNYEASDQQWPTGHTLKELKENLYDQIIQQKVLSLQAKKDKAEVDEEEAKKKADDQYEQLWEEMGEDQFENILEQNYTTVDSFKSWLQANTIESDYAAKATEKWQEDFDRDPSRVLKESVGKINDTDVSRGEYEYRLLGETLNYYMQNQTALPTDDKSMEETNKTIFEGIEKTNANIQYCEDNDIEISQESIDSAKESLSQSTSYFFQDEEQTKNFLENYYLTQSSYDEYQLQEAKGNAAEEAIQKKCEDDASVTDADIEKYYKDNEKKYDTSEVSAMHILTEDEDAANSIYDEAKDITKKEDFQALVDKYKDVENVKEATDLGAFDYGTMVPEFSDAAFNAELNTTLKPVKTQYGYHVIFVYDKKDGEVKSLDEVKDEIEDTLRTEEGQEDFDKVEADIVKGVHYDIPDVIKSPIELYTDKLESDYNVVEHEGAIRA